MSTVKSLRNVAVLASWVCAAAQTTPGETLYWSGGGTNSSIHNEDNWTPAQAPASGDLLYWDGLEAGDLDLVFGGAAFGGAAGVRLFLTTNQTGSVDISLVDTASRVFRLAAASSIVDGGALTLDGQDATVRAVFELGTATAGQTVTFNNNSSNTATFGQYTTIRKNNSASNQSITFRGSGPVRILGQINNHWGGGVGRRPQRHAAARRDDGASGQPRRR